MVVDFRYPYPSAWYQISTRSLDFLDPDDTRHDSDLLEGILHSSASEHHPARVDRSSLERHHDPLLMILTHMLQLPPDSDPPRAIRRNVGRHADVRSVRQHSHILCTPNRTRVRKKRERRHDESLGVVHVAVNLQNLLATVERFVRVPPQLERHRVHGDVEAVLERFCCVDQFRDLCCGVSEVAELHFGLCMFADGSV